MNSKVVVGLSGGVDSSVAAASLRRQGYDVIGLTLWLMKGKGQCCSEGLVDAAQLCDEMGIPHHVVDTRDLFQTQIVDYLVSGYAQGITPLPCSQCNRTVKFSPMIRYARQELGADKIATGHYARIRFNSATQRYQLCRAVDRHKDQSYFLYDLDQDILAATLFPLGEQTKPETRRMAAELGLHTAEKPESQDLCLIEVHGSMQTFLDQYIQPRQGEIVDRQGNILGHHEGVHHYTIGQRKGLGVAAAQPLYVIGLDAVMNRVIVGDRNSAQQTECTVQRVNWVSIAEPNAPIHAEVQVRYRSQPVGVTVVPLVADASLGARVKLIFDEPQFGITPGQAAVWYDGEVLLGGGILERPPVSP
ncbi:tRNA 2-thiouridine(34) synthase MnmA [Synechococcales cyanobacterium C]|uniref:tRNA-specific 2-thiouridylase MnmA n=1 Tax=Petrachloros mirabilis ULC683 TaxID=2781853 RepID=A0A8K1ZYS7_9CYAN|nr:tRNA 2-thiouridine(34) synthase MnmA [Petrachloros mirabilis]NCJ06157.1 tRNA 2-thiouridine(34) synthase MnmA [Petrachloros mirabilis ULC683]